ncbi:MAG: NAD(P)H-quinone oxidoreductase subunit D4, partial [Microcystis sp.]
MLNAFIWLPIIGAILIAYTPLEAKKVRGLALTLAVVLLLLNILLGWQFDPSNPQMQFTVNL